MMSFSVLVNGSPSRLFRASRRLTQGDPLSAFLFTIGIEALSTLLSKAKDCGLTEGFEVGRGAKVITHLQFVDDTIIFSSSRGRGGGNVSFRKAFHLSEESDFGSWVRLLSNVFICRDVTDSCIWKLSPFGVFFPESVLQGVEVLPEASVPSSPPPRVEAFACFVVSGKFSSLYS